MTPRAASASKFLDSDSLGWDNNPGIGGTDPFWGYVAGGENFPVSTSRWGDVAVIQPADPQHLRSTFSSGYDPTPLFTAPPSSAADAVASPTDVCQVLTSESTHLSGPAQTLTRKRPHEAEQAVAPPSTKKPADRKVQIDSFTWILPPDPGPDGPYPKLVFLIGAAISSSESGTMMLAGIVQWIRERYPSRQQPVYGAIKSALCRGSNFINIRAGQCSKGIWKLRDPFQFSRRWEAKIAKHRLYDTRTNRGLKAASPRRSNQRALPRSSQ